MYIKKNLMLIATSLLLSLIIVQYVNAENYTHNGNEIKNQYIVVLKSSTSNQILNSLIEKITAKGVNVIALYDQPILKGFAFSSKNITLINNTLDFLKEQPEVEYVVPDKSTIIFR